MAAKAVIPTTISSGSPSAYEDSHVHSVYDTIAHHFSSTRYKPWPVVANFLANIPSGSIGLDAGCGNGKYLIAPSEREGAYWTIGLDRSIRLLEIARRAGDRERECVYGDVLGTPWRNGAFDFAISIATIHHLSTPERRMQSIQSLLRCLSPSHGRGLIYVWAIQQDDLSKRSVPNFSEENDQKQVGQDVFVPWKLSENTPGPSRKAEIALLKQKSEVSANEAMQTLTKPETAVFNRYYHMFDRGELRELVITAAQGMSIYLKPEPRTQPENNMQKKNFIEIVKDDWERSNYYVEFRLYQ